MEFTMDHHNDTMTRQHRIRPIHTAIGEGAYPRLVRLLHRDFHPITIRPYEESMLLLLWEPNGTPGWTACHFAASQFVPAGWWEWILRIQAASVHRRVPTFSSSANNNQEVNRRMNMFLESKNALGQTVTDIFFRSYVRPLPWQILQVKNRSKQFLSSVEIIMSRRIHIKALRDHFLACQRHRRNIIEKHKNILINGEYKNQLANTDNLCRMLSNIPEHSNHAIQRVTLFLVNLHILCQAILQQEHQCNNDKISGDNNTIFDEHCFLNALSRTGNCPRIVANLIVTLFPSTTTVSDSPNVSVLPIHHWCMSQTEFPNDCGLLETLLLVPNRLPTSYDDTPDDLVSLAMIPDPRTTKLPLLMAVQYGKSWSQVQPLFLAAPCLLRDTVFDGLPLFAWAAIASACDSVGKKKYDHQSNETTITTKVQYRARQDHLGDNGMLTLWDLATSSVQRKALNDAAVAIECEQLTTIFEILISCPLALIDASSRVERNVPIISIET